MEKIIWSEKYNIGVESIDSQHEYLIGIINEMISNKKNMDIKELRLILNKLITYANVHFNDEENLMLETNYPKVMEHKKLHDYFIEELETLEKEIELENIYVTFDMLIFLSKWFVNHISLNDREIMPYLNE